MSERDQPASAAPQQPEPQAEQPPSRLPPGDISVYIAPGMTTVTFSELVENEGLATTRDIEQLRGMIGDLQRQMEELHGIQPLPATQEGAAPERPATQQRPATAQRPTTHRDRR